MILTWTWWDECCHNRTFPSSSQSFIMHIWFFKRLNLNYVVSSILFRRKLHSSNNRMKNEMNMKWASVVGKNQLRCVFQETSVVFWRFRKFFATNSLNLTYIMLIAITHSYQDSWSNFLLIFLISRSINKEIELHNNYISQIL